VDGARGLDASGIVVGYEWDLEKGSGILEILVHDANNFAGYAPAGRMTDKSDLTGNLWAITLTANYYSPSGEVDAEYFADGDRVKINQFDGTTQVEGIVTDVTGNVVTVQFDGVWTPGTDTWDLIANTYTDIESGGKRGSAA